MSLVKRPTSLNLLNFTSERVPAMQPAYFFTLGVFVLVMFANGIPIVFLCCSKSLRRDVFYRGLVCLCVNALAGAPFTFLLTFYPQTISYNVCIFLRSLTDVFVLQANFHHLLISFERFCACRMTKYYHYFTSWHQVIYIFLTYGITVGCVIVIHRSSNTKSPIKTSLIYNRTPSVQIVYSSFTIALILGVLLFTVLSIYQLLCNLKKSGKVASKETKIQGNKRKGNSVIFCVTKQQTIKQASSDDKASEPGKILVKMADERKYTPCRLSKTFTVEPSSSQCTDIGFQRSRQKGATKSGERRGESVKTMLIVVLTLVVCNVPYHVVQTVSFFTDQNVAEEAVCVTYYMNKCQYILNPVIYMWRIRPVRDFIRDRVKCNAFLNF